MTASYIELFVDQGESFEAEIILTDQFADTFNLAHYIVQSDARKHYYQANVSFSFDTELIDDGNNGIIKLSLDQSITQNTRIGKYVFDVFISNIMSNTRSKALEGIVYINGSATRI